MSDHHHGFKYEALRERPDGYHDVGYEFEWAWPPVGAHSSGYGRVDIDTMRVVGWEKQTDQLGNERIGVRCEPIARRSRHPRGIRLEACEHGHVHEVFDLDGEPAHGEAPDIWGVR